MNYTQNDKIEDVIETTIVIFDIESQTHYTRDFD